MSPSSPPTAVAVVLGFPPASARDELLARATPEHRAGERLTLVPTHLAALVPSEVSRTPKGKSWG